MLPLSDHFTVKDNLCTQCVGNLPAEYEQTTPFQSVASGEKEQIMLPLSDHFTCQGQTITMCTQTRVFKGNLPAEYE